MASVKLAKVYSLIKGFNVYQRKSNIGKKLNCVLDEQKRHCNTAIKLVWDDYETIGHMPIGLS